MCVKRSTAPGPRMPSPTKATRTFSIFGAVSPSTCRCPAGRSGTSTTIVPFSHRHVVEGESEPEPSCATSAGSGRQTSLLHPANALRETAAKTAAAHTFFSVFCFIIDLSCCVKKKTESQKKANRKARRSRAHAPNARTSSGETVAVPNFPTTMPAAVFAKCAADSKSAPAASASVSEAMTVSPAPETSKTSRA